LARTPTNGSEDAAFAPVFTTSSSGSSRAPRPVDRTLSTHSLLAATNAADLRRLPQTETITTSAARASISMPPPTSKPSVDRRLSTSLANAKPIRRSEDSALPPQPGSPTSFKSFDKSPFPNTPSPPTSTTNTDTTVVTTASAALAMQNAGVSLLTPPALPSNVVNEVDTESPVSANFTMNIPQSKSEAPRSSTTASPSRSNTLKPDQTAFPARAPRTNNSRSISAQRRLSTPSQKSTDTHERDAKKRIGTIGVCALDAKARSKPSRQILTRLQGDGEFEVVVFGDKAILDEDVSNWPVCDFLISFFSQGFPLDKAIEYVNLRKPFVVNDLQLQKILWDRRLCLKVLDLWKVPTPRRIIVNRDGGPKIESPELAKHLRFMTGVILLGASDGTGGGEPLTKSAELIEDGDAILVDGNVIRKPFVEKPISGEDHNIIIYFPKSHNGGGARRLFRKIGNKSSEFDPNLTIPRAITDPESTYIYEQFLQTDNAEDVKVYTVGPAYSHAELRKAPVVDGLVKRNTHGKEIRYVTNLNTQEQEMASRVSRAFGQRICGLDLLRAGGESFVIDVNGWSFVKDNENYYNKCAEILRETFSSEKLKRDGLLADGAASDTTSEGAGQKEGGSSTTHSHRSALKTIFKSPSITRLSQHLSHGPKHASSPRTSMVVPLSSPPSVDRPGDSIPGLGSVVLPEKAAEIEDVLPPPAMPAPQSIDEFAVDDAAVSDSKLEATTAPMPLSKHSWKLKGFVAVIRHADRTPKEKIKFTAHSAPFVELLKGHHEEVLLKGEAALSSVEAAVKTALREGLEDQSKLRNLENVLKKKKSLPATKVQIKPMFKRKPEAEPSTPASVRQESETSIPEHAEVHSTLPRASPASVTEIPRPDRHPSRSDSISGATFSRYAAAEHDLVLDKLQLVLKWGGEPTHSARYQSTDLGGNMRDDYKLLNRSMLDNVQIFSSSEKRVKITAQIWGGAFLGREDIPEQYLQIRKDLLDDSNAAKDVMDTVKRKLKHLLREGSSVPSGFAWPADAPEPYIALQSVIDLLRFHRTVMRENFKKLRNGAAASLAAIGSSSETAKETIDYVDVSSIQSRWCSGENPEMFKERWEKLFAEFVDTEKTDPSKISELWDCLKYEALHNHQFLLWVFTPSQAILDEQDAVIRDEKTEEPVAKVNRHDSTTSMTQPRQPLSERIGFRRKSVMTAPPKTPPLINNEQNSYFKLFPGSGDSKLKGDRRLGRLRELYRYAKILFDYISPQEYGISDDEKLEIGLLTSLPLLREIVADLEELQSSNEAKSFIYFTKESKMITLLNCIMEGGIPTKIKRSAIPEMDYLSSMIFELYEATDQTTNESKYSIRISISPGAHTLDPLDISLDSKHAISCAPRRTLTDHHDWKYVISTLKAKFDTVKLPQSFLAVNVSAKHEADAQGAGDALQEDDSQVKAEGQRGRSEVLTDESMIDM
jgi:inositol-hexakisphosphate/diphosphoinositol-pentakisphosphate 1-kinase